MPCVTVTPRLCRSTVIAWVNFLPAPKCSAQRDDVTQNAACFLSNVSIKLEACTLCCSFWLQHTGSSFIYSILCQPHDPSSKEFLLSPFCRPTSLEQPLPIEHWTQNEFSSMFPHKDNNHSNLSIQSVSPVIKQRQKCCFTRRDSAP